ncbi:Chorismate synthase [Desulfovibrio sp. X2]|uniref:chorismate synthase n=1 Tax=Desulfovibrio sp. X2 TaxID=941449 RepID=UPI0003587E71|nr:chorismate synthase [Desulfovibrio sp. X2]EPR43977.1 Chorismate synthase [Desulfovibrio sp. X2]
MSGNTFGREFRLTTFGESHGRGLGGVIDGCPAGIALSEADIQAELDRRKPGQGGAAATARQEADRVEIWSGVFEGLTTGTPIGFTIANQDQRSRDYSKIKDVFRPGHADLTFDAKFGLRDYRGGGRSSGRETASRVAGGAVAQCLLREMGVEVLAYPVELGGIAVKRIDLRDFRERPFFSPDLQAADAWEKACVQARAEGETLGGVVEVVARGVPAGWGEPVFDKLDACLAHALMGIGAVKGVEIGSGFAAARSRGSVNNDSITRQGFSSNNAGGILGGISSGQEIVVRAAIKPIPSIARPQRTLNRQGEEVEITVGGRHDVCAIPRVVPVCKAMVLLVLADMWLRDRRLGGECPRN